MLELKKNILKFAYGINYKYEGMLSHSFDRFYVVTKFEDLKLTTNHTILPVNIWNK